MPLIDELAKLLNPSDRALGGTSLASFVGATHLCIFIRDPELGKFLPAPGFPQKLPDGIGWSKFLRSIAESDSAQAEMLSPFSLTRLPVSGFRLSENAVAVIFGHGLRSDAWDLLAPYLRIIAALLVQEVRTNLAQRRAALANEMELESRQLAMALSEAHDKLAEALDARETLVREIRKKDERLQLARRISGIGVWELHGLTREIYLAPETTAIYGLPSGEFLGSIDNVTSRIHHDDQARVRGEIDSALAGGEDYETQFRVIWPGGIVRWIEERGTVIREGDGSTPTMIGFSLDITQRAMTEESLIRSEKLAAAGRLAASIAHEINNPLEALVNLIYIAKNDSDLSRIHGLLTQADEELLRISSAARQALGFYREGSSPSLFDVSAVTKEIVELFSRQIRDTGVLLKPQLMVERIEIEGWPGEIKQAISNLLINAVHASRRSGSIRIRVRHIRQRIQLTIADEGHGISREHLQRIFEPFFSTKRNSGTGLGLWVTKQIVERHGGSIRVRSNTDTRHQGTVFLLSLPVAGSAKRFDNMEQNLRYRWLTLND